MKFDQLSVSCEEFIRNDSIDTEWRIAGTRCVRPLIFNSSAAHNEELKKFAGPKSAI
ncbi:hypothetical protein [Nitrosomonas sp.]|uniref:hypothetical protein n=1 Tax=Nitrosomonas sp. TaxID=42353 RepID=UPI001DACCDC8|nr:hypothetical protein [Nitrosomonas sp.]MBX3616314.1 hypothetical protein [Nitrosomonas sp.]